MRGDVPYLVPGDSYCQPCCPKSEIKVPCGPAPGSSGDDTYDESFDEIARGMAETAKESIDKEGADVVEAGTPMGTSDEDEALKEKKN